MRFVRSRFREFLAIIDIPLPVLRPVLQARLTRLGIHCMTMDARTVEAVYKQVDLGNVEVDFMDHRRKVPFLFGVACMAPSAIPWDLLQPLDLTVANLFQEGVQSKVDVADFLDMAGNAPLGKIISDCDPGEGDQTDDDSRPENADPILHNTQPLSNFPLPCPIETGRQRAEFGSTRIKVWA
ncbi:MAG: hypothetical protein AMJ59_20355 [Gammaproteobacteria bacterium SG8_31]|nr:MAG: hypothetical protein AMJ59_20355 [Gammaproteobacteria bacterium SG8_31]